MPLLTAVSDVVEQRVRGLPNFSDNNQRTCPYQQAHDNAPLLWTKPCWALSSRSLAQTSWPIPGFWLENSPRTIQILERLERLVLALWDGFLKPWQANYR